jgi:hypothetical protein
MAVLEGGSSTAGIVNVDANYDLMTSTPQVNSTYNGATGEPAYVGATRAFFENDSGLLSGTPILSSPWATFDNNLQVGLMTPLFDYQFNATSQDTSMWYYAFLTMTTTQSGGFVLLNAGNIGTTTTGAYLSSKRYFNLTSNAGIRFGTNISITLAAAANEVWYVGLGVPVSTTASPTDGIWFQYSNAGLIGVVSYNGVATQTGALPIANPLSIPINTDVFLQIRIHNRVVIFMYNGSVLGSIPTPAAQPEPCITAALPAFIQYINTGTVAGSNFMQLKVGSITVDQLDSALAKPFSQIQAGKGLMPYQGTQGAIMGTTALYPNSLATGTGNAMTNTTAALGVGFGGQFSWLPTLASGTDGILSSYLNPVGSITQPPRTMFITGVRLQSMVTTLLVGGPVYMFYSLGFGGTTLSLATAESASFVTATAKASRRIVLGMESFPSGANVGITSNTVPITMTFASPVVVNPGEYVQIVAKNVGAVTTAGLITTLVTFDSYLE